MAKASQSRVARILLKKETSRVKPSVDSWVKKDPEWAKKVSTARHLMLAAIEEKKPGAVILQLTTEFETLLRGKGLL